MRKKNDSHTLSRLVTYPSAAVKKFANIISAHRITGATTLSLNAWPPQFDDGSRAAGAVAYSHSSSTMVRVVCSLRIFQSPSTLTYSWCMWPQPLKFTTGVFT